MPRRIIPASARLDLILLATLASACGAEDPNAGIGMADDDDAALVFVATPVILATVADETDEEGTEGPTRSGGDEADEDESRLAYLVDVEAERDAIPGADETGTETVGLAFPDRVLWQAHHPAMLEAVAVDAHGNIVAAGNHLGAVHVQVRDADAAIQWESDTPVADAWGGARDLAVDPASGRIAVAATLDSDDGPLAWVGSYAADGTSAWSVVSDDNGEGAAAWHVTVGADGQVTASGDRGLGSDTWMQAWDMGGAPLWTASSSGFAPGDMVAAEGGRVFAVNDARPAARVFEADGSVAAQWIGIGADAVERTAAGTLAFWSVAGSQMHVDNLALDGHALQTLALALPAGTSIASVALDAAGNIILGGSHFDDFETEILVAKYAPDGAPQWTAQLDLGGSNDVHDLAVAPDGTIVVVGAFLDGNESSFLLQLAP